MAATTTTTRWTTRCTKHAFAPRARSRLQFSAAGNVTLPGHGHIRAHTRSGLASESSIAGNDPVNGSDPSGLCKDTSISCRYDNLVWEDEIKNNGGSPLGVSHTEAENLLVSNNIGIARARGFVDSFTGGIEIGLLSKMTYPLYRYLGSDSKAKEFSYVDRGVYRTPHQARAGLALPSTNLAKRIERAIYNVNFTGADLYLMGMVAGGRPLGAVQYALYDPNEVVNGPSVSTGQTPPAPGYQVQIPSPLNPDEGGGDVSYNLAETCV